MKALAKRGPERVPSAPRGLRGLFSAAPRPRAAPSTNDRLLARNRRLADAFGVDRQRAAQTVAWPPALVLWAQRTLATHVDGLAGGGGALRALERKLALPSVIRSGAVYA